MGPFMAPTNVILVLMIKWVMAGYMSLFPVCLAQLDQSGWAMVLHLLKRVVCAVIQVPMAWQARVCPVLWAQRATCGALLGLLLVSSVLQGPSVVKMAFQSAQFASKATTPLLAPTCALPALLAHMPPLLTASASSALWDLIPLEQGLSALLVRLAPLPTPRG